MNKSKLLIKVIFKSIWLAFAVLVLIAGLIAFISLIKDGEGWAGWFGWGVLCAMLTIVNTFKTIFSGARQGARDGTNHYTYSNGYISNHPFLGALFGFIIGIVVALLLGPIYLLVRVILVLPTFIEEVRTLRALNQDEDDDI